MHYHNGSFPSMQKLTVKASYKCSTKATQNCTTGCTRDLTRYALVHWINYHGKEYYKKRGSHTCAICKLGFPSAAMLVAHLQQSYGGSPKEDKNIHAANMKKRDVLWHVDGVHINADPNFHFLPNFEELKSAFNVAAPRKFHAMSQFRFSS